MIDDQQNKTSDMNNLPDHPELKFFSILYLIIYWTIYILSWLVIPIAQEYEKAGDFTAQQRIKRAIKTNVYMYLLFAVIGVVFVIYLMIKKQLTG